MIESMHLKNFKSFLNTDQLKLAPITVISGQNSSGKSSLIQSLLLLKQTLESPVVDEPLLINGAYVSLGEFADIVNYHAEKQETVDFSFKFSSNKHEKDKEGRYYFDILQDRYKEIELKLELLPSIDVTDENLINTPILNRTQFRGKYEDETNFDWSFKFDKDLKKNLSERFDLKNKNFSDEDLLLKPERNKKTKIEAVSFNSFVPESLFIPYNEKLDIKQHIIAQHLFDNIFNKLELTFSTPDSRRNTLRTYLNYIKRVRRLKRWENYPDLVEEKKIMDFYEYLDGIFFNQQEIKIIENRDLLAFLLQKLDVETFNYLLNYVSEMNQEISNIKNMTETLVQRLPRHYEPIEGFLDLNDIGYLIRKLFNRIQYLGPLRDEPRTFYGKFGSHNPLYVGQKGENVAFVLKYYSKRKIKAILPPSDNREYNPEKGLIEEVTLGVAVQKWLEYLGIAKEVKVEKMGKVGLTIQANIHGDKHADLTNVGVGVSQVLPLVVLGLSASNKDSVLLLEQPELHLHPYVQSRLADFFITLSQLGKQIIAETHSEHLINRLRYHIAKGSINYQKDVLIYFCTREKGNKQSEVIKVKIDKFGSIDFYPPGFFDETEKQLEAILLAAFERDTESELTERGFDVK